MNNNEASNTVSVATPILDMIVPPFFKRLGDCTGEERRVAAEWLKAYATICGWEDKPQTKPRIRAVYGRASDMQEAIDGTMAMYGMKRDASGKWVKDGEAL
jgi:hypothetical protein